MVILLNLMELDESIFQVDVLKLLENAGWNLSFYSTLASLLKSNLRVSKGNLKVDMGIQGINYTYKSSKGHAH